MPRSSFMRRKSRHAVGHSQLMRLQTELATLSWLRGFRGLTLETEFARWLRSESAVARRWLMSLPLVTLLLAPLYGPWLREQDVPETLLYWLRVLELGIAAPLCALSLYCLYRKPERALTTHLMLAALLVVFVTVAAIRWLSAPAGLVIPPGIVMVVPLALASLGRLRLFAVMPALVVCPVAFLVAEWFLGERAQFASIVLGTLLFSALAVITAVGNDQLLRRTWLSMQIVELTAMSDAVTRLPNRQWINRDLAALFGQARREKLSVAVLLIDLDHFKRLNDSHGHAAGDAALAAVGQVLARFGRRPMDLAGRFGGEEFLLVLHDAKLYGAERIAAQLVSQVEALGVLNKGSPLGHLTASEGLYVAVPRPDERPENFLHQADLALYDAKQSGRNRYVLRQPPQASDSPLAANDA